MLDKVRQSCEAAPLHPAPPAPGAGGASLRSFKPPTKFPSLAKKKLPRKQRKKEEAFGRRLYQLALQELPQIAVVGLSELG